MKVPWYVVAGFGGHIKATKKMLIVQKGGRTDEIPLTAFSHLLIMGGHTLHTSALISLLETGRSVSFFEADGEPVGFLRPFGDQSDEVVHEAQKNALSHSYALRIARGSASLRILRVEEWQQEFGTLLYEGELEILRKSLMELEYLIRIDEIRRVHRLVVDMYYEILSRTVPQELGFRRRTARPHVDLVNTMLSFGYGMLFGNAGVSVVGAHLDPDRGFLHKGKRSLVYDLIDPFKPSMIDQEVAALARGGIDPEAYECTGPRCILSDELMHELTGRFQRSIRQELIDEQVRNLVGALLGRSEFSVVKP